MSERKSTSTGDVWNSGMVAFARGYSNNRHNENAYDVGRASKGSCAWRSEQFLLWGSGGSNRAKNDFYSLWFGTPRGFTILDSQGSRNALHINVRCRRSSCCGVPNSNFELRKQSLVHNIFWLYLLVQVTRSVRSLTVFTSIRHIRSIIDLLDWQISFVD